MSFRQRSAVSSSGRDPGALTFYHADNVGSIVKTTDSPAAVTRQSALNLAHHEPDLFVVYLGNNEVVGPYGASSVAAPLQANLGVVRAGVWARPLPAGAAQRQSDADPPCPTLATYLGNLEPSSFVEPW